MANGVTIEVEVAGSNHHKGLALTNRQAESARAKAGKIRCQSTKHKKAKNWECRTLCAVEMKATIGGGEGGCTQFVHGHSRMTIDPRIPTMPGRSTSGFHQPGRHCLHQASTKRREVFGESHEGWAASFQEPLVRRTSAPSAYFLAYG